MCNLYSNTMPVDAMRGLFKASADKIGNQPPLPGIFPRYDAPIVRLSTGDSRELIPAHRGFLMPMVAKRTEKPIQPKAVNNARDDKIRVSRFWKSSFAERRCLIPATAFCEAKGRTLATYYWFGVQTEDETGHRPFAFAGLWRSFKGNYRDELVETETYTMVTTTPNELVSEIHPDRMPVILHEADFGTWLGGGREDAYALLKPFPADRMLILGSGLSMKSEPEA